MLQLLIACRPNQSHQKQIGPVHLAETGIQGKSPGTVTIVKTLRLYIGNFTIGTGHINLIAPDLIVVVGVVVKTGTPQYKATFIVSVTAVQVPLMGVEGTKAVGGGEAEIGRASCRERG